MKKKINFLTVVLCGIAALIWTIRAVVDVVYHIPQTSTILFLLDILCAVIWIVTFFINLYKYRSNRTDK